MQGNVTEYQKKYKIKDAKQFLDNLRFLVQNFLLETSLIESSAMNWFKEGIKSDFIFQIMDGEFLDGVDKDLIPKVHPIFNYDSPAI